MWLGSGRARLGAIAKQDGKWFNQRGNTGRETWTVGRNLIWRNSEILAVEIAGSANLVWSSLLHSYSKSDLKSEKRHTNKSLRLEEIMATVHKLCTREL